jgi:hypothetical protein
MSRIKVRVLIVFCVVLGGVSYSGRSVVQAHENTGTDQKSDTGQKVGRDDGISLPQPDVVPQIAECTDLLFEADFTEGEVPEEWVPLHGTQWSVVDGSLQGRPSTNEFQQKRIKSGNSSHSGKTPSSRLLVPVDDCVMLFRFKLVDGLSGAHFGFNDGSFKTGTGHVCRFTVSVRKGQSLVKDRNVTVDGDEDDTLVTDNFNVKADTWYWMMLEIVGDEMVAQVSGGPVLRARHPRFNIPKDQINLPTRGGGVVLYDNVRVWNAVRKK